MKLCISQSGLDFLRDSHQELLQKKHQEEKRKLEREQKKISDKLTRMKSTTSLTKPKQSQKNQMRKFHSFNKKILLI